MKTFVVVLMAILVLGVSCGNSSPHSTKLDDVFDGFETREYPRGRLIAGRDVYIGVPVLIDRLISRHVRGIDNGTIIVFADGFVLHTADRNGYLFRRVKLGELAQIELNMGYLNKDVYVDYIAQPPTHLNIGR